MITHSYRRLQAVAAIHAVLLSLLFVCPAQSADVAGRILGAVTDASKAAVPGASLTAKNSQTDYAAKVTSNEEGQYAFESLPPGIYTITCEQPSFKTFVATGIEVVSQRTLTLPIALTVGALSQSVEVSAAALMVNVTSPTVQNTFSERTLLSLPVSGRDPRVTAEQLMPGASGGGSESGVSRTSFNGVSGAVNNYRVDGTETIDYFHSTATPFPAVENLQEFTVQSSLTDASSGRGAGGAITAVIKSGSNSLHGGGWTYRTNQGWNANNWYNNTKSIARPAGGQKWYGGNVGGPVFIPKLYNGKSKTFFFTSYEDTRRSTTSVKLQRVPSDAIRGGDFSKAKDGIPIVDGVPTPMISPALFSPAAKYLLSKENLLPRSSNPDGDFSWYPRTKSPEKTFIGKIDQNFNPKHRLFGSLFWYRYQPFYDVFLYAGSGLPLKSGSEFPKLLQDWTLNDTYIFSPTLLNNVVLGVKRLNNSVNRVNPDPDLTWEKLGMGVKPDLHSDSNQVWLTVNGGGQTGFNLSGGYDDAQDEQSIYLADNATWIRGRHTMQMGYEHRIHSQHKLQNWGAGGDLAYANSRKDLGGTNNGFADFMLGRAASFSQSSSQDLIIDYPSRETYFQDRIRVSRRLSLSVGLRWEPHFGVIETRGRLSTFRAGQQSTGFPTAPTGLVVPGDAGIPQNLYGTRWGNLSPRVGIAYSLLGSGRASIRAGYGRYNDYQFLKGFNTYGTAVPYGLTVNPPTPVNMTNPYAGQYGSFPFVRPTPGDPANSTIQFPTYVTMDAFSPDYNSGQVHQWNTNFEIEPFRGYLVTAGYVGTRGTHLDYQRDINWPRFVPGASSRSGTNVQSRRLYNQRFQAINMHGADANSRYNSFQLSLNKRLSHGIMVIGNYVYSATTSYQNGRRLRDNYSIDYYSPGADHNLRLTYNWELPFPGASRLLRTAFGGWVLGGTISGSSGSYLGISANCNHNMNSAGCVGNYVGGEIYGGRDTRADQAAHWLNRPAFCNANETLSNSVCVVDPKAGVDYMVIGNATNGIAKGPARLMNDMTLNKRFPISERAGTMEFRLAAFNVFNHTVLGNPDTNIGQNDRTLFGQIRSASGARNLQLSLRYLF